MLDKSEQRNYCQKRCQKIQKHLHLFAVSKDMSELHKLRLEIKKIQSLLFIVSQVNHHKKVWNDYQPLKKIFKHAGAIRSANINLQFLNEANLVDQNIKRQQHSIINEQTEIFISSIKGYSTIVKNFNTSFQNNSVKVKNKQIYHLYKDQYHKIVNFLSESGDAAKLHKYRKKIKLMLYLNRISSNPKHKIPDRKVFALNELQKTIGKWHDEMSALELIKNQGNNYHKLINTIEQEIESELNCINTLSLNIAA